MAKGTSQLSDLSLPVWCKLCLIRAFHLQTSSSITKSDANLKWKHFKCLTLVLFSSQSILVGPRSPPAHLCCFVCKLKTCKVLSRLEIKTAGVISSIQSHNKSTRPKQKVRRDSEDAQHYSTFPPVQGWGCLKHNTLQWGAPTQQQEQCTGLSWGAGTPGSSCVNAVWLFLPAQRCHLVSRSQQHFNPLDVFLPFNKCHCTGSSISVSARQEDQYGQMPQAKRVTNVTKHLMSSVSDIPFQC